MNRRLCALLAVLVPALGSLLCQPVFADTLAVVDARVHTLTDRGVVDGATVLIEDGRITAVGTDLSVPAGYEVVDAGGRDLTPGLFVAYSTIGLSEVNAVDEANDTSVDTDDLGAAFSVARAVNPDSVLYGVARAGGVLYAMTGPLPGQQAFAGQASVIRLDGSRQMLVAPDAAMIASVGITGAESGGGSRAAALLRLEQALVDAQVYANSSALVRGGQASNLSLSRIDLAALASFVASGRPLGILADRASDILHAVAILRDRGIQPVILGGAEAWKVADELAAANVPVLLDPLMNIPGSYDELGARMDGAAILHRAGVRVGIMEGAGHDVREIRQYAGNAVAWGLPREVALAAITRVPAQVWRVDDRIGRIAPGMAADLVVWTGDPLELTTWAETVIVAGRVMAAGSRQQRLQERYRDPRAIFAPLTPGG